MNTVHFKRFKNNLETKTHILFLLRVPLRPYVGLRHFKTVLRFTWLSYQWSICQILHNMKYLLNFDDFNFEKKYCIKGLKKLRLVLF